jgi:hypothetical protein
MLLKARWKEYNQDRKPTVHKTPRGESTVLKFQKHFSEHVGKLSSKKVVSDLSQLLSVYLFFSHIEHQKSCVLGGRIK